MSISSKDYEQPPETAPEKKADPEDQALIDPLPPRQMDLVRKMGGDFALQLSGIVDQAINSVLEQNGGNPAVVNMARLGIAFGMRNMETTLLHILKLNGAPMKSVHGSIDRYETELEEKMTAKDEESRVMLVEPKIIVPH